jgi:hypothetical protein
MQETKKANLRSPLEMLAEWTGLEPATPGVTGRYSNQLNYHSLPSSHPSRRCMTARKRSFLRNLVGAERLELPTYAL